MLVKEYPIAVASGNRAAFHGSYDFILSLALSLLAASVRIYRYERLFAVSGVICSAVTFLYLGRPIFF